MIYQMKQITSKFEIDLDVNKFIFNKMCSLYSTDMTAIEIGTDDDFEFFLDSQEKVISLTNQFYFDKYKDYETDAYSNYLTAIANLIYKKYYKSWKQLHDALLSEYNPIENYSMTEDENVGSNVKTESKANTYGFNTTETDGVPQNKGEVVQSGNYEDNKRHLVRKGNIGVTTTQQMIVSSIDLFKHKYLELIYRDLNDFLFSSIYL